MCGCKVKKKKWASHVRCIKRRMGVDKGGSDGNGDRGCDEGMAG